MYCEAKTSHVYYGDVEHIKPKGRFQELEFNWGNLGYVCARCNGRKGDKFEMSTPYVNPYEEDPSDHILAFGSFIRPRQGSERGELTINDIDLNRESLIERRQEKIKSIETAINACFRTSNPTLRENALAELQKEGLPDKEYSLWVRSLLSTHGILEDA